MTSTTRAVFVLLGGSFVLPFVGPASACAQFVTADEVERIQVELAAVEEHLRAQDVSHLTGAQRRARATNIDNLHDYWLAGVFPQNTFADHPVPIFIDGGGRACAVAHLMIESGWEAAAQEVRETQNLAYVNDITSTKVAEWVAQSGLTLQEAAWIQPAYDPCGSTSCNTPVPDAPVCGADGRTYIHFAFAWGCGEQEFWTDGCCPMGEEILAPQCDDDPPDRETLCEQTGAPPPADCADMESALAAECCAMGLDPVCGADGHSYFNACFAERCGQQVSFVTGCCEFSFSDLDSISRALPVRGGGFCGFVNPMTGGTELCEAVPEPQPDAGVGGASGAAGSGPVAGSGGGGGTQSDDIVPERGNGGCAIAADTTRRMPFVALLFVVFLLFRWQMQAT